MSLYAILPFALVPVLCFRAAWLSAAPRTRRAARTGGAK